VRRDGRRAKRVLVAAVATTALLAGSVAYATTVAIDGTFLTGGGGTSWNPENFTYACTDPGSPPEAFVPVDQGTTSTRSDAFDDGFVVWVGGLGGEAFQDPDGNGDRVGQGLAVGPASTKGLRVSETEKALQSSPTLRMLYRFKNTSAHSRNRTIALETALGSDTPTTIDKSSSGDKTWSKGDRWLVTHEEPFGPTSDPVVTQVWFGRHARERVTHKEHSTNAPDCFLSEFKITVPAHAKRYLLFFAEMNNSISSAKNKTAKFNQVHLTSNLRNGIRSGVRNRILNWDL
jgi:hypothetical protein